MHGLIHTGQTSILKYVSPFIHSPLEQLEYINEERLLIESLSLENELSDYFTILDYINKINSGWFSSCLRIQNEKITEWLNSDLESYRFFREFSEYLTQISESFGVSITDVELELAQYEYPQDDLDEIVIVLRVDDSIPSDAFMNLWNDLSQESYNFIKNEGENFENLFKKSILVLRRSGDD